MAEQVNQDAIATLIREVGNYSGWLIALSLGTLLLFIIFVPPILSRLPSNYFQTRRARQPIASLTGNGAWRLLFKVLRNLAGLVFIIGGVLMLVLPGQGLLTMLVGLLLCDFPGKRSVLRWFVLWTKLAKPLNRYRQRHGKPPFVF